jgi:hypothetical protein
MQGPGCRADPAALQHLVGGAEQDPLSIGEAALITAANRLWFCCLYAELPAHRTTCHLPNGPWCFHPQSLA